MRKIFNTLEEATPEPEPCLAQKADLEAANQFLEDALLVLLTLEINNKGRIGLLKNNETMVSSLEAENIVIAASVAADFITIGNYRKSIPTADKYLKYYLQKGIIDLQEKIIRDNKKRDVHGTTISTYLKKVIPYLKTEIAKGVIEIEDQTTVVSTAKTDMDAADIALSECLSSPLHIRLNLNHSCKELKQNIKIVNQKIISLNNKLINLNSGLNSLNILNINKDFFDKNIKNTKEFIVKLDKLNPNPSDSSFLDVYKKAQEDLASYQEKRKISRVKIKTSEEKIKTIPDKQNALEDKTSNKIQKFVNCKTPTVI